MKEHCSEGIQGVRYSPVCIEVKYNCKQMSSSAVIPET